MLPSIHKLIISLILFWVKAEHHRNLQYMETATLNQEEQINSFLHSSEELYHNIPLIQCFFYANCYIHTNNAAFQNHFHGNVQVGYSLYWKALML